MLPCPDPGVLPTCTWLFLLALGCPTHYLTCGRLIYVLACGCPTYRSGTWLPNTLPGIWSSTIWHLVAQLYGPAHGCPILRHGIWSAHGCPTCVPVNPAVHIIRFRWTSFILTVILCDIYYLSDPAVTCDALWTYHSCVHDPAELCIYFTNVNPQHSMFIHLMFLFYVHCYCLDVSLLAHPYDPDFSMLYSMSTSPIRYSSAPYYLS